MLEEYDEYFHIILAEASEFSIMYIDGLSDTVSVVYGPKKGGLQNENHVHCFIFTKTNDKEEAVTWVEENKTKVRITGIGNFYNAQKYTEKEPYIVNGLIGVDKADFSDVNKTPTFEYCVCDCGYWQDHKAGEPCQDIVCPECGGELKGCNEKPKKPKKHIDDVYTDPGLAEIHDQDTKSIYDEILEYLVYDDVSGIKAWMELHGVDNELQKSIMDLQIELKAGAVLNKANKDKLSKASELIQEVLNSAEKETEDRGDEPGDEPIIRIIDIEDTNDVNRDASVIVITDENDVSTSINHEETIVIKDTTEDDLRTMLRQSMNERLGKLD